MICEKCGKEFSEDWRKYPKGKARFCSIKCSNSRIHTKETKEKISKSLSKEGSKKSLLKAKQKHASFLRKIEAITITDISKRTISKIVKRMNLKCSNCGWYVEGAVGDIHHILEVKNGGTDDMSNLTYLCPNCHRMVHSGVLSPDKLIGLQDYVGDSWKDYYYIKKQGG